MFFEPEYWLVVAMFVTFIALIFTGFPVAWVLAGVGILFAGVGYITDMLDWTFTGLNYNVLGMLHGRIFAIMYNWVLVALPMFCTAEYLPLCITGYWLLCLCSSLWG